MSEMCPHCGFNLRHDEIVTVGAVSYDPRGAVTVDGAEIRLAPQERSILGTLLKSRGRCVGFDVLGERAGSNAADVPALIRVCIAKLRSNLEAAGFCPPIETVWGVGYRWAA